MPQRTEMNQPKVLADHSRSQASCQDRSWTESGENGQHCTISEHTNEQRDQRHKTEITSDGVRITREESIEAVKVIRESNIVEKSVRSSDGDTFQLTNWPWAEDTRCHEGQLNDIYEEKITVDDISAAADGKQYNVPVQVAACVNEVAEVPVEIEVAMDESAMPHSDAAEAAKEAAEGHIHSQSESTDSIESPEGKSNASDEYHSEKHKKKGGLFSFFKRKQEKKKKEKTHKEGDMKDEKSGKNGVETRAKSEEKDKKVVVAPNSIRASSEITEISPKALNIRIESSKDTNVITVDRKQVVHAIPVNVVSTGTIDKAPVNHSQPVEVAVKVNYPPVDESKRFATMQSSDHKEVHISTEASPSKSFTLPRPTKPSRSFDSQKSPSARIATPDIVAPMYSSIGEATYPERSSTGHFVVVAVDFGTTFSGYAFSFTKAPDQIHMMGKWEGGDPGVNNQKTPTTLLLYPNQKFHSFGFTARDFYHDLDPKQATEWLYFEKFKMTLHYNAELNKNTVIKAANGAKVPALDVFSHALRFFKDTALEELSKQAGIKILNEDVRWVITVPAIWKAPAKQFMREAAYKAGMGAPEYPDQLLIALEPEAASIYVRRLRMHQLVPENPDFRPLMLRRERLAEVEQEGPLNLVRVGDEIHDGSRYIIVDCGGGTVDITAHEMNTKEGKLKELYKATGGPFGSVGVDNEFEKLLMEIFGADFIEAFKIMRPVGWVDLMVAFESRKRAANPVKTNPLNVALPFSLIDYYKRYTKGNEVDAAVRKYKDPNIRWSPQGMLRLNPEAMRRLFAPTLESIKAAIGDVLNNPNCRGIHYMFLVGGFAESPILQQELRREFGHLLKLIIPQEVSLSIVKGAVLFGLDPTVVNVRRSRSTYGVEVLNRFVEGKHDEAKKVTKDGVAWCTDIFDTFVVTDQAVGLGDSVLRSYTPVRPGQTSIVMNIYCTENPNIKYVTDPGVSKCGALCLDLSDVQYQQVIPGRRQIQARMVFGDTEIKVSALDVATGKCVRANIDFLS